MSIKYKLVEKTQPGIAGGGNKKWYAQIESAGEVTINELVEAIELNSALSESDIRGVIISLLRESQKALAKGMTVRLEDLGSLYPTLSSEGTATKDAFNADSHIKGVKVNYRPGSRITNSLNGAKFARS